MDYYAMSSAQTMDALKTKKEGLGKKEAESRLKIHGYNKLPTRKGSTPFEIFFRQFSDTLVIILIIATIISFFIGEPFDAILILLIVLFNSIFGFIQEYHAERAVEALEKMLTPSAIVVRDGHKHKVPAQDVVPGDIVFLGEGDSIVADLRLIEANDFQVSEALLTGESAPVSKNINQLKKGTLTTSQKNMAFSGTLVTRGEALGVVVGTGHNTEIGRISKMLEMVVVEKTPLQKRLAEFGKSLGKWILLLCVIIFFLELMGSLNFVDSFLISISLAVAAIPEGLPAVVTIALATGLFRMMRQKALVRRVPAVEALGSVTVICSDKTGTLTKNEMTVVELYTEGNHVPITHAGFAEKINHPDISQLLKIGALCNSASIAPGGKHIGDPTEIALLVSAHKGGFDVNKLNINYLRKKTIPFTSSRKMMSTINESQEGVCIYTKGAVNSVLGCCNRYFWNGKIMPLTKETKDAILQKEQYMCSHALRVLGFAYKPISHNEKDPEKNLVFVGLQGMIDPPREGVKKAIFECKEAGIKVVMITGDHKTTATAIANSLDITGETLSGEELAEMSDEELKKHVEHVAIYARATPKDKIRIITALQELGQIVAMTGDGVNDAPALKKANIGVAMGMRGTEVAKQASAIVLTDDNFTTIVSAAKEGRRIFDNIKKFINALLSCNISEVVVILASSIAQLPLPITAVQLLWINLVTDGLPAVALSIDPESPNIMKRPPRNPRELLIPKHLAYDIVSFGLIMGLIMIILFYLELPKGLEHAQTMVFTGLVLGEFVRLLLIRKDYSVSLFSNMWLIFAILIALGLQFILIYTSFAVYFKTAPLGLEDWKVLGAVMLAVFAVASIVKMVLMYLTKKHSR